ncbi:acyltransferase family protein [Proteus vulgaris]|uniref:acyltransferase family protein n=1 Tax=Proteus vulgaris TaxID=585 RepID=UPI0034D583C9
MQSKKFRADINGLRAIAVLSVMFFHFNQGLVPGGFAGVDVFFVISGFLMTSIIFRGLESNNFSLWSFLKARARRIVPALVTVISIVLALGYLFFEPLTYQLVGKHGFSSLLFISNITYANEAGYFDADSFSKLFLHTWSLSVEWQFYIIYPIILLILSKLFSINTLKKFIVVSAIISFVFCVYFSSINKTLSYFMIYTRGWEMLLGGIAFLFPLSTTENKKRIIELLGLILIITSFFIFSDADNWPSYNALLPVFGAYLCILANSSKTILSNFALQKIGLWSYSIYLVHWTFIVFLKKINITVSLYEYIIFVLAISFILYFVVEKKRNYSYKLFLFYILMLLISFYVGINGISKRINNDYIDFHKEYYGGKGISTNGNAERFNPNSTLEFIIVGDSFARQYANFFKNKNIGFIGVFQDGCFSMNGYYSIYTPTLKNECIRRYTNLRNVILKNPKVNIIIAQQWNDKLKLTNINDNSIYNNDYIYEYIKNIRQLSSGNIYILGITNGSDRNVFECMNKYKLPIYNFIPKPLECIQKEKEKEKVISINYKIKDISNRLNVTYIDTNKYLCTNGMCSVIDTDKKPIYSDWVHLSIYGAKYIGEKIKNEIE